MQGQRQRRDRIARAQRSDHLIAEDGNLRDFIGGAGEDVLVDEAMSRQRAAKSQRRIVGIAGVAAATSSSAARAIVRNRSSGISFTMEELCSRARNTASVLAAR